MNKEKKVKIKTFFEDEDGEVKEIKNAKGTIGFINAESKPYCSTCNRLRLSSDGKIYPCLFSDYNLDVRRIIRADDDTGLLSQELDRIMREKPEYQRNREKQPEFAMCSIGG